MRSLTAYVLLSSLAFGWNSSRAEEDPAGTTAARLTIHGQKRHQRIDGFGSGLWGGFTLFERGHFDAVARNTRYRTDPEQRQALLNLLLKELQCKHVRVFVMPAGIEMENDNDDPAVMNWNAFNWEGDSRKPTGKTQGDNRRNGLSEWRELLAAIKKEGDVTWVITPGRMPPWLKAPIDGEGEIPGEWFEEYAEWAAAHVLYLKKTFGMEAPYWTFHNEADHLKKTRPADFWKKWTKVTGRRFRKEGLNTRLMIPDYMNVYMAVPLVREVLKDEEARQYVGALAYHHYRSSGDGPQPFLQVAGSAKTADAGRLFERLTGGARGMAALGKQYGIPSWQTETAYYPRFCKGVSEWKIARARANEIYYELASGASAVHGMCGIWVDSVDPRFNHTVRHEGHHIVMKSTGDKVVGWEITKDCGVIFAHYARFVQPGCRRVGLECSDPLLRCTAMLSADDDLCVGVIVNNAGVGKTLQVEFRGLEWAPTFHRGVFTDEKRTWREVPVTRSAGRANSYSLSVEPLSVTTVVFARKAVEAPFSRAFLKTPGCRDEYAK